MIIDTHAHLDYSDFAGELDEVIARAAQAGRWIASLRLAPASRAAGGAVALAQKYPNVYAVIGVASHERAG